MLGGRVPDVATLRAAFTVGRLTTVTGPPGAGKTTVAVAAAAQAARSFRDGTRLVPVRELPDEALLAHAVMRAAGVPDRPALPQADALCRGLAGSGSLLVFDGCEHMIRGCAALARRLLRHCPRLHIAVTSTEPLGLDGEHVYTIASGKPAARDPTRAAIGRGHQSCAPAERLLWARLSVFGTDFTLRDAAEVCADRHLPAAAVPGAARGLARRSLLLACPGTGRYRLPGAVRDYGAMMLRELGEETGALRRHRAWREVRR